MTAEPQIDVGWFRQAVTEATNTDPGELDGSERLEAIGVRGIDRFLVLASIETTMKIDFPHDLEPALETVADFLYYARLKVEQANSERGR